MANKLISLGNLSEFLSNLKIFKKINIGSDSITASNYKSELTVEAGSNVTIAADTTANKITISSADGNVYTAGKGIDISSNNVVSTETRVIDVTQAQYDALSTTEKNDTTIFYNITNTDIDGEITETTISNWGFTKNTGTVTNVATGTGLVGGPINGSGTISLESGVVTAGTAGTTSATSGSTLAVPYVTVDTYGRVKGYGTHTHTVSGFSTTDTKNTAGSTDTSSKLFLIGATSQAANPQTYSQDTAYVGTDGCLYSGGTKVITDISGKQDALTTQTAYSAKGTSTKVPQITTNTLGQVTNITEVDISGGGDTSTCYKTDDEVSDTINDTDYIPFSDANGNKKRSLWSNIKTVYDGVFLTKKNPEGTGTFSLNRKTDTEVGAYSFVEGYRATASGNYSHAEGYYTTAAGDYSHAEGTCTTASGLRSHAEGCYTLAPSSYQHVQGKYNVEDTEGTYAHIVGNGASTDNRSNAHTLDWDGNAWFAGTVKSGNYQLVKGITGTTALGGSNQPVYINSSNVATACNTFVPNTGGTFNAKSGTAGSKSYTTITIGNSTGTASAGNSTGRIRLYASGTSATTAYYNQLYGNSATTANVDITFPASAGTLALTSSDVRLKENITDTDVDALDVLINKVKIHSFDWKKGLNLSDKDGQHQNIGFVADELEEIDPYFIVKGSGGDNSEGGINPKCIDDFYLSGYIVKAIQQLYEENQELKARIEALER